MIMIEQDSELQGIYDKVVNNLSKESFSIKRFNPFSIFSVDKLYLVSGQNSYFNNHIQQNGLNNISVEEEDAKVIAILHSLVLRYGHPANYGDNNSIVYVTPPGTIELDYARQSFPSGILEDVFCWQGNLQYPFPWYTYFDDIEIIDLIADEDDINQILNNKATFFAEDIRDGKTTGKDYEIELSSMFIFIFFRLYYNKLQRKEKFV